MALTEFDFDITKSANDDLVLDGIINNPTPPGSGDPTYGLVIPSAYSSEISSITSIVVNKKSLDCATNESTFTLLPFDTDMEFDIYDSPATPELYIKTGSTTNISTYSWDITRSGSSIFTSTDATPDVSAITFHGNSDTVTLVATLTNGLEITIVQVFDSGSAIGTHSWTSRQLTYDDTSVYTIDSNRDIKLNTTTWAHTDGVWSVSLVVSYVDSLSANQSVTTTRCYFVDDTTGCNVAKFNIKNLNTLSAKELVYLYKSIEVAVSNNRCCDGSKIFDVLTKLINRYDCC